MTDAEVRNNPNLIIMYFSDMTDYQKELAISLKPFLLETIPQKTDAFIHIAFCNGYWSETVAKHLKTFTNDEINKFVSKATSINVEEFLNVYGKSLDEEGSINLILNIPEMITTNFLTKSENFDKAIIDNTDYLNSKMVNPLCYMYNLTQDKVDTLYAKVGKWALLNIPAEFQRDEMKKEILDNNIWDFRFVAFDERIAQFMVTDYPGVVSSAMQEMRINDPYATQRILMLLKVNGINIQYLKKPTEEEQIIAVQNNPMSIQYIEKPCDDAWMEVAKQNPNLLVGNPKAPKKVCQAFNIPWTAPSLYEDDKDYLVTMSKDGVICYRIVKGCDMEAYMEQPISPKAKVAKIAKFAEITSEESAVLKRFGMLKTKNPFFDESKKTKKRTSEDEE